MVGISKSYSLASVGGETEGTIVGSAQYPQWEKEGGWTESFCASSVRGRCRSLTKRGGVNRSMGGGCVLESSSCVEVGEGNEDESDIMTGV